MHVYMTIEYPKKLGLGVLYFNTFFWCWVPIRATYTKKVYIFSRVYSKAKEM